MPSKEQLNKWAHHPILAQSAISLSLTALSLLLLVLVLLSFPGPIKGLYWFSVAGEENKAEGLSAGVLGWCMTGTSNCTYAPLSDNPYLSTMINVGQALTVRIMLPAACYWLIVTLITWVILTILVPIGYRIDDLDSISRHLGFAIVEACVLCISLFGNVLTWLAFGLGRMAYLSVKEGGGKPKSGRAMETTAVAATISLISLFTAGWGLYLRLAKAQKQWKEEAVMVRRRSMAAMSLAASNGMMRTSILEDGISGSKPDGNGRNSAMDQMGLHMSEDAKERERRWSDAPDYMSQAGSHGVGLSVDNPQNRRESVVKIVDDEEKLASREDVSNRTSREQERMIRRASVVSTDSPYAAAANAQRGS